MLCVTHVRHELCNASFHSLEYYVLYCTLEVKNYIILDFISSSTFIVVGNIDEGICVCLWSHTRSESLALPVIVQHMGEQKPRIT